LIESLNHIHGAILINVKKKRTVKQKVPGQRPGPTQQAMLPEMLPAIQQEWKREE
jgi:hypothetical protein